jgi:4-hydroxy-tetrahydrodipicolinate synthase
MAGTQELFKSKLKGVHAVSVTPFDSDLTIDWNLMERNLSRLVANQVEIVYPGGNTAEFFSLTVDEAKQVLERAIDVVSHRASVVASAAYDLTTACELAKHAADDKADAVMIHQPAHPYLLPEGLYQYYRTIAESTPLPVVIYVRRSEVTPEVLAKVTTIENVVAIKYAVNDLVSFTESVQMSRSDVVWLCGSAEMWAPYFFAAGAEGFTTGLINVTPMFSFDLLNALKEGRRADYLRLWSAIKPFEKLRARHGNGNNVSVVKEAMFQLGLSTNYVRPPISPLSVSEKREIHDILVSWGLLG